jgi:hypothetical protein
MPPSIPRLISGGSFRRQNMGRTVIDASELSIRMAELQRMRVALVILLSQENSKLLSRRQRVAGKEIEVMCAERDLHEGTEIDRNQQALDKLTTEERSLRAALEGTETEIRQMEDVLAKIDADISKLCQA